MNPSISSAEEELIKKYSLDFSPEEEELIEKFAIRKKPTTSPKQFALGLSESIPSAYGNLLDLFGLQTGEKLPGRESLQKAEFEAPEKLKGFFQEEDILPQFQKLPTSKDVKSFLESLGVDEEPETFLQKYMRRVGGLTGSGIPFGQFNPLQDIIAGGMGQILEEAGASPLIQALGELSVYGFPKSVLTGKIAPKPSQASLVKKGRELGLTEKELAPALTKESFTSKLISKFSPKGGRGSDVTKATRDALGNVYTGLKESDYGARLLKDENRLNVISDIEKTLENMPSKYRKKILEDFSDLKRKPITGESLIDFYQDVNQTFGPQNKRTLVLNKNVSEALQKHNPDLAEDFRLVNQLYSNTAKLANRLKPPKFLDVLTLGSVGDFLFGLSTMNLPVMASAIGFEGARYLAREMLLNPRLKNLSYQLVTQLNKGSVKSINQILNKYSKEIENEKVSEEIDELQSNLAKTVNKKQ